MLTKEEFDDMKKVINNILVLFSSNELNNEKKKRI